MSRRAGWDVVVLGLGAAGSAAACHLARRGARVLGLEQHGPLHALGSSHGRTRIIRVAYFEHPDYVPLLRRAWELWRALERDAGRELLLQTGGLMIGPPGGEVVAGALRSAREHGLEHRLLDAAELRREHVTLAPEDHEVAVHEPDAGVLFTEACLQAHLERAVAAGAELRFGARARLAEVPASGPITLELGGPRPETIQAEKVVLAAGAWTTRLLSGHPELGPRPRLHVERNWVAWLEPVDGPGSPAFAPGRFPIFIWDRPGELAHYGFPAVRGDLPKVAFHHAGQGQPPQDPDAARPGPTDEQRRALLARLRETIPALAGRIAQTSTCLYTNTSDGHFVLDRLAGGRLVLASPCSGHGFKFATVLGEVLADLTLDGSTRHPIGFLGLGRPGLALA